MKNFKFKCLLVLFGVLIVGINQAWAYNCNYANVYYDNSVTQWTYVQLLYENSGGSTGWNMSHVAHTDLYWKAPGAWSDNNFSGVRFADGTSGDWPWSTENSWTRTGNQKKECTGFFGGDIANNVHLFTCNIKTYDDSKVNIGHPYYGSNPTMLNKTVNVGSKIKVGNNDFSASVASVAAISMKHYSFNSSEYASVQDYYSSNVPTHSKGSTTTYTIYPTYTSNVTYSFSNLTSGYEFVGWYDGEDNLLSKNEEYTVYTTSNYDVYAYFAQTHTVNISAGEGGEVSVSGDQTIGQNGLSVTATPSTGYMFDGWDYTDGVSLSSSDATMTITATAAGTVTARFVPIWSIKGSDTEMGSWDGYNDLLFVSETTFSTTIALAADHTYEFKVYNRNSSGSWYGYGSSDKEVTFTRGGTKSQSGLATDKSNLGITTDVAGDYMFTWNTSGNVVSVTYPTPSYTISYRDQGNADFSGTQTSAPTTHIYGTPTTLKIPTKVGYNFAGWWTDAACTSSQVGTNSAATLAADGYTANIILYAKWTAKTTTVSFNQTSGTGGQTSSVTAIYDAAMPTPISTPIRDNYTFDGYWDGTGGTGTKYYNANGTSARTWNKENATYTLHAKWTEDTHTVTVQYRYSEEEIASDGSISNVGITTTQAYTAPSIAGYTFSSWTLPVSGVTIVTGGTETASIVINATADATIVANYTPTVYNGKLKESDGTEIGEYSVIHGSTTLTVTSAPTKKGYHVYRYYLTYDGKDYVYPIAEPSETDTKQLIKSVSITTTEYTDNDGKWEFVGGPDIYVRWEENTYNVELDARLGTGTSTRGTESFTATTDRAIPAVTMPTQVGYDFKGYYTSVDGDLQVLTADGFINLAATDYFKSNGTWKYDDDVTLYAHWDPVGLTFSSEGDWDVASNWTPACVPTSEHDVTIAAEATVNGSAVAKSVTINQSTGKITIESGRLEVIQGVTNSQDSRLVIKSGAAFVAANLTSTAATAYLTVGSDGFNYIALPTGGVSVSSAFAGQGVYTYVWKEGDGWERRGYYDDILGNEPIAISGQNSWVFSGTLVSAPSGGAVAYSTGKTYAGTNMYTNNWTAPIKIHEVSISENSEQSVYIYNGSIWSGIPTSSATYQVVPAMYAYVILAKGEVSGTFSINYDNAVRNIPPSPTPAPRRKVSSNILDHITMSVVGNELEADLRLYENKQFTNEFDNGWEAHYLEGDGRTGQLYVQTDDKITVLATPNLEGTVVGFIPGEAANYTISFEGDGKGYYLNDMLTQQSTLIAEGNTYMFNPDAATNATRFVISRTPLSGSTATGMDSLNDGTTARKQMINGVLYIIREGKIYEATGKLVK